ncbi:MAG: dihydroorotate dehydrogenase electron transfer subunit [Oscillospiraceae bacterium]|nr:dihydroorotate dehydrogenase electron transfer subunit [Oscillospiraceae bacterium]
MSAVPRSKMSRVISNERLADGVYLMRLEEDGAAGPGQFYMLGLGHPLLPRPLSICEAGDGWADFCYVVYGAGTMKLAAARPGDTLRLIGPLGNGFDMDEINAYGRVAIISGGAGVAPFVEVVKHLKREPAVFCGFSDFSYLTGRLPNARVAVESGGKTEAKYTGFVTDLLKPGDFDAVLACGPEGFSRAVVRMCAEAGTPLYISLDRRMACGVGACMVCACATTGGNKRCCADGPVFKGGELII